MFSSATRRLLLFIWVLRREDKRQEYSNVCMFIPGVAHTPVGDIELANTPHTCDDPSCQQETHTDLDGDVSLQCVCVCVCV